MLSSTEATISTSFSFGLHYCVVLVMTTLLIINFDEEAFDEFLHVCPLCVQADIHAKHEP